jgi:hypothetical protein
MFANPMALHIESRVAFLFEYEKNQSVIADDGEKQT